MNDDAALLRRFADDGTDSAFTALVRRHVDLVYAAALRRTDGDAHLAADVAQQVFITLAREAGKLSRHTVLSAWLHTATRNAALNLMISEQRRRIRERAAHALAPAAPDTPLHWEQLRPVLDSAIDELSDPDRTAVVLRFLEQRPFAEIGAALNVSADAARVRTNRALEQLRAALGQRGVSSSAAAIGALVSGQPLVSVPAGLASSLAAHSLAQLTATGPAATSSPMLLKLLLTATTSAVLAFGAGAYFAFNRDTATPPAPVVDTSRTTALVAGLRQENLLLRAEVDDVKSRLAALAAAPRPKLPPAPGKSVGEQQRSILNNLRQLAAARDQFIRDEGRVPLSSAELVGYTRYVKRYLAVDGEDYRSVSLIPGQPMTITTASGLTVTFDPVGGTTTKPELTPEVMHAKALEYDINQAEARITALEKKNVAAAREAETAYRAANAGRYPAEPEALLPFFATPQQGADWVEFLEAVKAAEVAHKAK